MAATRWILALAVFWSFTFRDASAQGNRWDRYLEIEGRAGDGAERSQTRSFLPLYQDSCNLLFGDIRMMYTDTQVWEGNFGLGYRRILPSQRVLGVYGFYDVVDTRFGNKFHQGSGGIELLDINWGARFNGYIPNAKVGVAPGGRAFFQSGQIFVQGNQERPYYGIDLEGEHVIYRSTSGWGTVDPGDIEIWGVAGFFYFDNETPGFREIAGPRARLEARLYDLPLLGNDSRLVASAQYEYDDVRGSVEQGFLSVRIPLGPCGCRKGTKLNLLDRRMVTPVVRDIDIVTNVAAGGPIQQAINAKTGVLLDDVVVLTSLIDIETTVEAAPDERVFIVDGVDGNFNLGGGIIDLNPGQILLGGGGSMLVEGVDTGLQVDFTANGFTAATIEDMGTLIRLGTDNGIYGLTLDSGFDAIVGTNPGIVEIAGNTFLNTADDFIDIDTDMGVHEICITNNEFGTQPLFAGDTAIEVDLTADSGVALDISGNDFLGVDADAVGISAADDSGVFVLFAENFVESPGENGFRLELRDSAVSDARIQQNQFLNVAEDAVTVTVEDAAELLLLVRENDILGDGMTDRGIDIQAAGMVTVDGFIEENLLTGILDDAVFLNAEDGADLELLILGNRFEQIDGDGVQVSVQNHDMGDVRQLVRIVDNDFRDVGPAAGPVAGGAAVRVTTNDNDGMGDYLIDQQVVILDNRFRNTGIGVALQYDSDSMADPTATFQSIVDVVDNSFRQTLTDVIQVDVADWGGENLELTLNVIDNDIRETIFNVVEIEVHDLNFDSATYAIDIDGTIAGNRMRQTGETAIDIVFLDEAAFDFDVLDNIIDRADTGVDVLNGFFESDLTIGGNSFESIVGTGIVIDADATVNLDDDGLNNTIQDAGNLFDIDDDGDVIGTIEINGTPQMFP